MFNVDDYMKLDYPEIVRTIEEDDEKYLEISIAELPGFFVYVDDYSEIKDEVQAAKKEWFAAQIELGRKIPMPRKKSNKSGRVTLRMPISLHEKLDYLAQEDHVSLNDFIVRTIDKGLQNSHTYEVKEHLEIIESSTDDIKKELQFNEFPSLKESHAVTFSRSGTFEIESKELVQDRRFVYEK